MKRMSCLLISILFSLSLPVFAAEEETSADLTPGYIADELIIYMHAGAGNNFRILGSVTAGAQINLTGEEENKFTQIIDSRNRLSWVESQYISKKPGLRFVIAELNEQLTSSADENSQLKSQLEKNKITINKINKKNKALTDETRLLHQQFTSAQGKLKSQDLNVKKEWFFTGAIVLGLGLLLGLVIPRLSGGRGKKMDSWK